ncbi:MAG: hypothetical protein JWO56_2439 [Acidobacteria bacterium]|nr:hypothetical protein [Acidobacteriota bacterium]
MSRRTTLLIALAGLVLALLLASFGFFFFRDNFSTHYALKVLSAESFRAGEIPWWNRADGGGQPLAGNPNALTFYPDTALYAFLPAHVAFNLHFLIHLAAAWFAMRALVAELLRRKVPSASHSAATFAAWLYVLSGLAITATAFYNLIPAVALIPLALFGAERQSPLLLGSAFGLLALSGEPVTILGAAIAVAIVALDRMPILSIAASIAIAFVIGSPQLIAYAEIASEVERVRGFSAQTILNASLPPIRLLEVLIGPWFATGPRLFLSLFVGLIAIPAILQRSRYTAVAATMLFLALGRFNPIAAALLPRIRIARYPEKFALPMIAALAVLAGLYFARTRWKRAWIAITFVPLAGWAFVTLPVDWFAPYRTTPGAHRRLFLRNAPGGQELDRRDYRARAARREPLFGAVTGLEYVLNRSSDNMHSLLSRIAYERFAATRNPGYLRIATDPPHLVSRAIGVGSVNEAVARIEAGQRGIVPAKFGALATPAAARITRIADTAQSIEIGVTTPGPAIVAIDQSYFTAWVVTSGGRELTTLPVDLDRLAVVVPAGTHEVVLRFGRHRTLVIAGWLASWLLLTAVLFIQKFDRRPRQVERAADDDRPLA